jgi:hypothetical protein
LNISAQQAHLILSTISQDLFTIPFKRLCASYLQNFEKHAKSSQMTTLAAVDTSKICQITNSAGMDVVVGMPLTSAEVENSPNPKTAISGDFVILSLGSSGTTPSYVIKNGGSDTVTLDRTHKDSKTGKQVYSYGYDLLISTSDWYRPIDNIAVIQNFDPDGYDPQKATPDGDTAMKSTADFYQTISAYPTSKLAQDYVSAMKQTDDNANSKADGSVNSAQAVNDSINTDAANFFKNTTNYKNVTLVDVVVLESYYNRFPFVWAQYGNATYYLYSNDGTATTFAGTLVLQKPDTLDITKPNGGYTCTFTPASNPSDLTKLDVDPSQATALTYSDGLFADDSDLISIKGSFQLKRTFTKVSTDKTIVVTMCGSINGLTSLGFDESQAKTPDDSTQDWLNTLFHPTTAAGIFNSVMTILGALMMLHFVISTIYGIGKWIKEAIAGKTPVTQADLQAQRTSINEEIKAKLDAIYEKVSNNKSTLPDNSVDAQAKAATETSSLSDQVSKAQIEDNMGKMNINLKNVEPFAAQDADLQGRLENIAGEVHDAHTTIENATTPEDLNTALSDVRPKMSTMTGDITTLNTDISNAVEQDQKQTIEDNQKVMDDVQTAVDEEAKTAEDEDADTTDTDPEADGIDFPPE